MTFPQNLESVKDTRAGLLFALVLLAVLVTDAVCLAGLMPSMVLVAPTPADSLLACLVPIFLVGAVLTSIAFIANRWYTGVAVASTLLFKLVLSALVSFSLVGPQEIAGSFVLECGSRLIESIFLSGLVFSVAFCRFRFWRGEEVESRYSGLVLAYLILLGAWLFLLSSLTGQFLPPHCLEMAPAGYALASLGFIYLSSGGRGKEIADETGRTENDMGILDRWYPGALIAVLTFLTAAPVVSSLLLSASTPSELYNFCMASCGGTALGLLFRLSGSTLVGRERRKRDAQVAVSALLSALFLLGLFLSRWSELTTVLLFLQGLTGSTLFCHAFGDLRLSGKRFAMSILVALAVTYPASAYFANSAMVLPPAYVIQPIALIALLSIILMVLVFPPARKELLSRIASLFLSGAGRKELLIRQFGMLARARIESRLNPYSTFLVSLYLQCPLLIFTRDGFLHLAPVKVFLRYFSVRILAWDADLAPEQSVRMIYFGRAVRPATSGQKRKAGTRSDYFLSTRQMRQDGPRFLTLVVNRSPELVAEKL